MGLTGDLSNPPQPLKDPFQNHERGEEAIDRAARLDRGASAGVAAALATPALTTLAKRGCGNQNCCCRIGPPPAEQSVQKQSGEQADRQVRTKHGLRALLDGCRRGQLSPNASLGGGKKGHCHSRECSEAHPNPARLGMVPRDDRADRLHCNIGSEHEETQGNQLLSVPFGPLRANSPTREQPDDDQACQCFDQAVGAEADQSDRTGRKPCGDRDRELDDMPGDPAPCQLACPALQPGPRYRVDSPSIATCDGLQLKQLLSHWPVPC